MKKSIKRLLCIILSMLLINISPYGGMKVEAANRTIHNNGLGGIYIDINVPPYSTMNFNNSAYTADGCGWFASARVKELTGKGGTVWNGTGWLKNYAQFGFTHGWSVPTGKALACYGNHVTVIEIVNGNNMIVSEGGWRNGSDSNGHCIIQSLTRSEVESARNGEFKGYIYLNGSTPPPQPTNPISFFDFVTSNVSQYDAYVEGKINNPNRYKFGNVGITIVGPEGQYQGKDYSGLTLNPLKVSYLVSNEMTPNRLRPGTTYSWYMWAEVNGTTYTSKDQMQTFTTLPVNVTGVSINPTSVTIKEDATTTLTATVSPSDATNKGVTWSSSNTGVATVSSSGVVTGVKAGTATITVKTNDGGKTASCTVNVEAKRIPVTGVSLHTTSLTLRFGAPLTQSVLEATVTPSDATNKNLIWKSSNPDVAEVNAMLSRFGRLTPKSPGTTTITVTTEDGGKTASCIVTVPVEYTVTFDSQGGSDVEPVEHLLSGEKISEPAAPTRTGYDFAGWYKEKGCINAWNFASDTVSSSITLFARWIEKEYTISFDVNGGVKAPSDKTGILYTKKIGEVSDASPERFKEFVEWNTKADGSGMAVAESTSPMDIISLGEGNYTIAGTTITLYAIYKDIVPEEDEVTVTFNTNGGSTVWPQVVKKGKTANEPEDPVKEKYSFAGWYADEKLIIPFDFTQPIQSDITVYAKWVDVYTVKIMNGDEVLDSVQVPYGQTVPKPADPVKKGYTFGGWYSDPGFNTRFDFSAKLQGPATVYAKLTPVTFTLKFDANGGTGSMPDQVVTYGSGVVLNANAFRKNGRSFQMWATKKFADNDENPNYNNVDTFWDGYTNISTYYDTDGKVVTLYAVWKSSSENVLLHYTDAGSVYQDTEISAYYDRKFDETYDEYLKPSYPGKYFEGWYTSRSGGSKVDLTKAYDGSFTELYAHWSDIEFRVTYHSNLDTDSTVARYYYASSANAVPIEFDSLFTGLNLSAETRARLAGWYSGSNVQFSEEELTSKYIIETDYLKNGSKSKSVSLDIYASWNPAYSYKVVFVADDSDEDLGSGGKYSVGPIPTYGYGYVDSLAADEMLYLTGDEFVSKTRKLTGWTYSVNGGAQKSIGAKATLKNLGAKAGDVVVFRAKWSSNETEYKLNLVANGGKVKSGILKSKYKYSDDPTYVLPEMEKTGYIFKGWYLNNYNNQPNVSVYDGYRFEKVGKDANVPYAPENGKFGDFTLYAVFEKTTYSVAFNFNGGTVSNIEERTYSFDYDNSYFFTDVTYSKPGYKFKYWEYLDDSGNKKTIAANGAIRNISATGRKDIEISAVWEPLSYTISYSLGAGASMLKNAPKKYKAGENTALYEPSRTGYTFTGWTLTMKDPKAKEITASVAPEGNALSTGSYGNIVLTANWEENSYMIRTLNPDGTRSWPYDMKGPKYSATYDFTTIAHTLTEFIYDRYDPQQSVRGFALKPTDKNPKYSLNRTYKMADIVRNAGSGLEDGGIITLYVLTEPMKAYCSVENTATGERKNVYYSPDKGVTVKAPAVNGFTFKGWEVTNAELNKDYKINKNVLTIVKGVSDKSISIKAIYTPNTYKIVLMPNAKDVYNDGIKDPVSTKGVSYRNGADILFNSTRKLDDTSIVWSREGYTLAGFSTSKNGKAGSLITTEGGLKANKNVVTLYAVWTANGYNINRSDAKIYGNVTSQKIDYDKLKVPGIGSFGKAVTLPAKVTMDGFTFLGWEVSGATDVVKNKAGYVTKIGAKNTADVTLTPVFNENTYTVKLSPNGGTLSGEKKTITLGTYLYTMDVGQTLNLRLGGDVFNNTYYNSSAERAGYNLSGVALSANGKNSIFSSKYMTWDSNRGTYNLSRLTGKDKGTVTLYIKWTKIPAPSKPVIRPTISGGTLYTNIDHYNMYYQAQYSTDPNFKTNVVTVEKDYATSGEDYQKYNTLGTKLKGQVYYVRARNGIKDSTGNCVYSAWTGVERASKPTTLSTP